MTCIAYDIKYNTTYIYAFLFYFGKYFKAPVVTGPGTGSCLGQGVTDINRSGVLLRNVKLRLMLILAIDLQY